MKSHYKPMGKCISSHSVKNPRQRSGVLVPTKEVKIKKQNYRDFYTIEETISENPRTSIFLATDKLTKEARVIKSIKTSGSKLNSIFYEVQTLQSLDHPNIIKIYEAYQEANFLHIVTEYCSGGELLERISSRMHFSEHLAALYMRQITSALIYLHKNSIVHRDLKPENIFFSNIDEDSSLKLINFSKISENDKTFHFRAPEDFSGHLSKSSNIWSLGVIFYLMLSGSLPFSDRVKEDEHFISIQNLELDLTGNAWKTISDEAKSLLRSMLQVDSSKRCTAQDIFDGEWLRKFIRKSKNQRLSKKSINNLALYSKKSKFKKALLTFMTKKISMTEDIERLLSIFNEVDSSGQGVLASYMILECIQKSGMQIKDPLALVASMDTNKTGMVTYSEFITSLIDWNKELNEAKLRKVFADIDVNGDGNISPEEFMDVLHTNYSVDQLKTMMTEADTNGDGYIDFQEFCNFLQN
jgi:calcium-dependent protein kinase